MNQYIIEQTGTLPIFRIYVQGRRTSAYIQFPEGKGTVPADVYREAERLVDEKPF